MSFFTILGRHKMFFGRHRTPRAWWRAHQEERRERELVQECASFLQGRFADRRVLRNESVPLWAWTNLLAHGNASDLRRERDAHRVGIGGDAAFLRARSVLAGRVLEIVAEGDDLDTLQHELLQPFEADLAGRREVVLWGPEQWLASLLRALEERRHRAPR